MDVLRCGRHILPLGEKTLIMGIVNVTPDSFSDGGEYLDPSAAVEHALALEQQGADIIDIGAVSTRPGSAEVSEDDEKKRLIPVLDALMEKIKVPVSVDTQNSSTAAIALEKGAVIINDVSGVFNGEIAELVKKYNAAYIVTHNPASSDEVCEYKDGVISEIRSFFIDCISKASACGLSASQLCLDPGIGFSKSRDDDLEILKNMQWLKMSPCALLCGVSRKRVTACVQTDAAMRDYATAAADTAAVAGGADIVRVHNVPAAVQSCALADRIYRNR